MTQQMMNKQQWRSVKDELPDHETVLTYTYRENEYAVLTYAEQYGWLDINNDFFPEPDIWMPLPELPTINKEPEVKAMFADIQRKLETLQGSDESFLFFAKRDLRGVLNGDDEDIITLVLFNMIKYDVVAEMFATAVEKYHNMPEILKREVRDSKPTHETFTIDNINQIEDENN